MRPVPRRRGEDGFSSVEVVIAIPVLVLVVMIMVAFGRAVTSRSDLANGVDAAARAGSLQRSYTAAIAAAQQVLTADLAGVCDGGAHPAWPPASSFKPGGLFTVRVSCKVSLLGIPGLPADVTLSQVGVAPLDPYRSIT